MEPQALSLLLSPVALAVLGLAIGSFLNVVAHRLPLMLERRWKLDGAEMVGIDPATLADLPEPLTLAAPRSRCPSCARPIAWHENVPLLGWLKLKGRCAGCGTRIPLRYPGIEVLTAVLFAAVGWRVGATPVALAWCGFVAVLVALAAIDWDTTLLPDDLTQPLLWAGLVAAALGWTAVPLAQALWGAVAGYGSLWAVYWLFKLTTGKEGMGHGDFKLLAALGAWLGASMVLPVVLAASVIGAVAGIAMKMSSRLVEGRYVPFGPFLAGAGVAVLLIGPPRVLDWLGWA